MKNTTFKGLILILVMTLSIPMMAHGDKEKAQALTKAYQYELGMTIDQSDKFVAVVEKYLGQRSKIKMNKTYDVKELNKALKNISERETQEMATFLSSEQMRAYKKLKKKLQPVGEVM